MTEFERLMGNAFAETERVFRPSSGPVLIVTGTGSTECILSNVDVQRLARENGFMPNYSAVAELSRAEATRIGLLPIETNGKHPRCAAGGKNYQRVSAEDDPHDSAVRLRLDIYRA